jgi:hypothetical protein
MDPNRPVEVGGTLGPNIPPPVECGWFLKRLVRVGGMFVLLKRSVWSNNVAVFNPSMDFVRFSIIFKISLSPEDVQAVVLSVLDLSTGAEIAFLLANRAGDAWSSRLVLQNLLPVL